MSAALTARSHRHASGVYKEVTKLKNELSVTLIRDSGRITSRPSTPKETVTSGSGKRPHPATER